MIKNNHIIQRILDWTTSEKVHGYKAMYNGECRQFKFEVGQTYSIQGKLKMCQNGFHFCRLAHDVLYHYSMCDMFELYEVESNGQVLHEIDKSCSSQIKILKKLSDAEIERMFECRIQRDENNRITRLIRKEYSDLTDLYFVYEEWSTAAPLPTKRFTIWKGHEYLGKKHTSIHELTFDVMDEILKEANKE